MTKFQDNRLFPNSMMYCEGRPKPLLRGKLHFLGISVILPLLIFNILECVDMVTERMSLVLLSLGTAYCWGSSSLFHCVRWALADEIRYQRLDHSAVFVNIGCTFTAVILLVAQYLRHSFHLYIIITAVLALWLSCAYGIWHVYNRYGERMIYWVGSIALTFPSFPYIAHHLTIHEDTLAIMGLLIYAIGAIIYGKRLINPIPNVFGFHEIFHSCTVCATLLTYFLIASLSSPLESRCALNDNPKLVFYSGIVSNIWTHLKWLLGSVIGHNDICTYT